MSVVPYLRTIRVQKKDLRETCRKYVAQKYGVREDQVRVINGRRQGIMIRILPPDYNEADDLRQTAPNPRQNVLKLAVEEILRNAGWTSEDLAGEGVGRPSARSSIYYSNSGPRSAGSSSSSAGTG